MSEMIDRVAAAIAEAADVESGTMYEDMARAAVEAMRKPTPEMHDAAWAASLEPNEPMPPDFPDINAGIWQAMINAAMFDAVGRREMTEAGIWTIVGLQFFGLMMVTWRCDILSRRIDTVHKRITLNNRMNGLRSGGWDSEESGHPVSSQPERGK